MIKYFYPDGSHCYRALHTTHAVFRDDNGVLIARAQKSDGSGELYEFKFTAFELVQVGVTCD